MASYLDCNLVMLKQILIFFVISIASMQCIAQRNMYEDIDSTTITNEDVKEEKVETIQTIETKTYKNEELVEAPIEINNNDIEGDTTIQFRNFYLNPDSVYAWKHDKKYAWITNLDSLLRQEEENYKTKQYERKNRKQKDQRKTEEGEEEEFNNSTSNPFDPKLNSPILKFILWGLAACFVGFIIFKLFLSKGIFNTGGKKTAQVNEEEIVDDDNMENDFDTMYKRAYNEGNMRIAMRHLFLKTLQTLNEKELITFATDKTNSQYTRELPTTLKNSFAQLALYYEYIWYGNVVVKKEMFDGIAIKFTQFLNKV